MEALLEPIKFPLNFWNKDYISPGSVGSVGDTISRVRLRQSSIDLPARYERENISANGSNVQDGYSTSYSTGGLGSKTVERPLPFRPSFKTNVGWRHQDIVAADRSREIKVASLPQFTWKSGLASVERAKDTLRFNPLPGGYGPSGLTRGGMNPRITSRVTSDTSVHPFQQYELPQQPMTRLAPGVQQGEGVQPRTRLTSRGLRG